MKKWFLRLAPLVLALVMVCGSCLTVFAADSKPDGHPFGYSYWSHWNLGDKDMYLYSNSPLIVKEGDYNGILKYFVRVDGAGKQLCTNDNGYSGEYSDSFNVSEFLSTNEDYYCIESNHDIYTSSGLLFFQKPSVLGPVAPELGMEKVLEPMMMILPVGLACLIGYLGLRKALGHLQGILHRA